MTKINEINMTKINEINMTKINEINMTKINEINMTKINDEKILLHTLKYTCRKYDERLVMIILLQFCDLCVR